MLGPHYSQLECAKSYHNVSLLLGLVSLSQPCVCILDKCDGFPEYRVIRIYTRLVVLSAR
jgi:hypothetical protein